MMKHHPEVVKYKFLTWVESYPRTGWYISAVVTLNLLLELTRPFG